MYLSYFSLLWYVVLFYIWQMAQIVVQLDKKKGGLVWPSNHTDYLPKPVPLVFLTSLKSICCQMSSLPLCTPSKHWTPCLFNIDNKRVQHENSMLFTWTLYSNHRCIRKCKSLECPSLMLYPSHSLRLS